MSENKDNNINIDKSNECDLKDEILKESNKNKKIENKENLANNEFKIDEECNNKEKDDLDNKEEIIVKGDESSKNTDEIQNEDKQELKCEGKRDVENNTQNEDIKIIEEVQVVTDEEKANDENVESKDDLHKYKYQIEEDIIAYERNVVSYKEWDVNIKELVLIAKKTFDKVNSIIEKFNEEIQKKLQELNDEDKKLIENRIKGINMINKMSKNVLNNGMSKLSEKEILDFSNIGISNDVNNKEENEIRIILNKNYSSITYVESQKSNLINMYFNFVEGNLLPIMDGIESGISFVKSSTKEIIKSEVLPIYIELKMCFEQLLFSINIIKIEIKLKTKIDFSYCDVLDVEETEDEYLDETIESVVRNGYEYSKDIYGVGHNHIIRQAQIVVYKVYSKK